MKTIQFRGKRIDNGEWVFGHYVSSNKTTSALIIPNDNDWLQDYEVVKHETVGQFTGLTDKNGKEIYEGDRIVTRWVDLLMSVIEEKEVTIESIYDYELMAEINNADEIEVIGSVHENPELL